MTIKRNDKIREMTTTINDNLEKRQLKKGKLREKTNKINYNSGK